MKSVNTCCIGDMEKNITEFCLFLKWEFSSVVYLNSSFAAAFQLQVIYLSDLGAVVENYSFIKYH